MLDVEEDRRRSVCQTRVLFLAFVSLSASPTRLVPPCVVLAPDHSLPVVCPRSGLLQTTAVCPVHRCLYMHSTDTSMLRILSGCSQSDVTVKAVRRTLGLELLEVE